MSLPLIPLYLSPSRSDFAPSPPPRLLPQSLSLSLPHSVSLPLPLISGLSLFLSFSRSLPLPPSLPRSLALSLSLSLSLSLARSLRLSLPSRPSLERPLSFLASTHMHTHTHTRARARAGTHHTPSTRRDTTHMHACSTACYLFILMKRGTRSND